MSGSSLPYHLRTNKVVERKIFFEILKQLVLEKNIKDYTYYSLGGPMLEDHQALHYELGLTNLVSIERNKATLSRQEFNKPFSCIQCKDQEIKDFVGEYDEDGTEPVIIWFDYTDVKWSEQFLECELILSKLKHQDIFKITFNANPDVLKNKRADQSQLDVFKELASSKYVSENLSENDVISMPRFAKTISVIFQTLSESSLKAEGLVFLPFSQYSYIDNRHHMLTITGIVLNEGSVDSFVGENALLTAQHDFSDFSAWKNIDEINVPDLTLKEKYALNQLLPEIPDNIDLSTLPFKLDSKSATAVKKLQSYIKYYRYIPNYQKVTF